MSSGSDKPLEGALSEVVCPGGDVTKLVSNGNDNDGWPSWEVQYYNVFLLHCNSVLTVYTITEYTVTVYTVTVYTVTVYSVVVYTVRTLLQYNNNTF